MLKSVLALIILCAPSVCSANPYDLGNNLYYETTNIVKLENGIITVALEDADGVVDDAVIDLRTGSLRLVHDDKTLIVNNLSPDWQKTLVGSIREWEFDNKL